MNYKKNTGNRETMRPASYRIKRDDQLASLCVPLRQQIIDSVAASNRACSVKEIAGMVNRTPDSLYFHISKLLIVDLLVVEDSVTIAGKEVKRYTTPSRRMRIQYDLGSKKFKQRAHKIAASIFRVAERDYQVGLESAVSKCEGRDRNLLAGRWEGFVSVEAIRELNQLIDSAADLVANHPIQESGHRIAITISLTHLDK